jgi:hypothetical protein
VKNIFHRGRDIREKKRTNTLRAARLSDTERRGFLAGVNADFAVLRNDPTAWQEELAERTAWDCTLADGLNEE